MAGQWVERPDGRWDWDKRAPAADPNPTSILNAYAGGPAMTRDDRTPRSVYDPEIGADGGGRYAESEPVPVIDPDEPVAHVDQLGGDDYGTGWAPHGPTGARPALPGDGLSAELVACPTCGTGVHPDRLRD